MAIAITSRCQLPLVPLLVPPRPVSRILRAPTVDCAAFRPCLRLSGDALLSAGATLGSVLLSRPCEGSASFVDRSQRDIHNRVGILDYVSEALSDKAALDRH